MPSAQGLVGTMNKEFVIKNFNIRDNSELVNLVDFFMVNVSGIKIKVFYENTGFYGYLTKKELFDKLTQKKYEGIDELYLEVEKDCVLSIIFHENLCILTPDYSLIKLLAKKYALKPYKTGTFF